MLLGQVLYDLDLKESSLLSRRLFLRYTRCSALVFSDVSSFYVVVDNYSLLALSRVFQIE